MKRAQELTNVQKGAVVLAHMFALVSLILTIIWAKGDAVEKDGKTKTGYLGGLDWGDKDKVFNWHPVLMVAGMVFAFTEALLAYRSLPSSHKVNKLVHLGWQTAAIILLSVGLRAVFKNHQETYKPDLWSLHSWLGIAVITLFSINYVVGVLSFLLQLPNERARASVLPYHVLLGICLFLAAIFTAESGVVEKLALAGVCTAKYPKPTVLAPNQGGGVHYSLLLEGCKVANWLGVALLMTGLCGVFSLLDLRPPKKHYPLIDEE